MTEFGPEWVFAGLSFGLVSGFVRRWAGQLLSMTGGGE